MKNKFRFTIDSIESLPTPEKRQYVYDDKVIGLGLTLLPSGKKTFHVRATVEGKTKRITIGKYPDMKIDQARTKAKNELSDIAGGIDPVQQKRAKKALESVTSLSIEDAVGLFGKNKERRLSTGEKLPLKDSTIASYKQTIRTLLGEELYQGPIVKLTEDTLTKRIHKGEKLAKSATATGCRSLSAVWNWLARQKDYRNQLPLNPVKQYSTYNEGLHVSAPRQTRLEREELEDWFNEIEKLPTLPRDFFTWLLFTGNRIGETKALDWSDIDWRRNVYHIRDPKNRRDVTLPLPPFMATRLKARQEKSGPIFPLAGNAKLHKTAVSEAIGKNWTNHDLRRTFSGIAQAVCNYTSVKRLLNHAFTDITEVYIGHSADLGEEIEKVEREILRLANRPVVNVVKLEVVG